MIIYKMEQGRTETAALPGNAECTVLQRKTMLGGDKPLHRFIKGQPKVLGIILVILGSSFFILSIPLREVKSSMMGGSIQPGLWLGPMFIVCGILYILTEYNPTKKTVTTSFAVTIVALLGALWAAFIRLLPFLVYHSHVPHYWQPNQGMVARLYIVFEVYILIGMLIFITMSALAGASLRSSHSQTQIVMTQSQLSTE